MVRFTTAVIGLSVALLFLSCASQKTVENRPSPKFQGMVLAKAVDESGTIGMPQEQTGDFNTEDEQVVALVSFENMSGTHKLRWEWVDPAGKVYLSTKNYPLMKEVYGYVRENVTRQSHRMQSEQTPSIVPPSDQWKDIALSRSVE